MILSIDIRIGSKAALKGCPRWSPFSLKADVCHVDRDGVRCPSFITSSNHHKTCATTLSCPDADYGEDPPKLTLWARVRPTLRLLVKITGKCIASELTRATNIPRWLHGPTRQREDVEDRPRFRLSGADRLVRTTAATGGYRAAKNLCPNLRLKPTARQRGRSFGYSASDGGVF